MNFTKFAKYLARLEQTTKRLEITTILTELIQELEPEETDKAIYLASGYLQAPFNSLNFNIADKMMTKILEYTFADPQKKDIGSQISKLYAHEGDLGNVAEQLQEDQRSRGWTVSQAYEKLADVARTNGTGSTEAKIKKAAELLRYLDKTSTKYAVRIMLGTLRLGFTEITIIAALAQFLENKAAVDELEAHYNIHPDIGLLAKDLKENGVAGLEKIKIETGVPVLSQKAQRVSGMEEAMERIKNVWAEFKFDGTRVQLHFDKHKKISQTNNQTDLFGAEKKPSKNYLIKTFTRNLEETTHQYPDIIEAATQQIAAASVILDGEAIGYNRETGEFLPFQETITRKRKYDVAETAKNIPLKYFVFDILYLNGKSLINFPLRERRKMLSTIIKTGECIVVDEHMETEVFEELQEYFEIAKEKGLEGLLVKSPEDPYQAGARSYSWIKLKKADEKLLRDSVDCVVLGYYHGKGVRSKFGIGGFLVGVYDPSSDSFKTITKIGTGLKEDDWIKLKKLADKVKANKVPANVAISKVLLPDVIVKPKIVVEIGADEISISPNHTAGYALRFPRLLKFRDDKAPTETTSVKEIVTMFNSQRKN